MANTHDLQNYRQFRDALIADCYSPEKHTAHHDLNASRAQLRWRGNRERIIQYRAHLRFYGRELLAKNPGIETHLKRALGISAAVHLVRPTWQRRLEYLLMLLPVALAERRLKALLRQVPSFEGRRFVFEHLIDHTLIGQYHYDKSLDFAVRFLRLPPSPPALQDVGHVDLGWLRAGYRLGLKDVATMLEWMPPPGRRLQGELVMMLVEEGVLTESSDVAWIRSGPLRWNAHTHERENIKFARQLVRSLMQLSVKRSLIATACLDTAFDSAPDGLDANVAVLRGAGIDDFSALFEAVGDKLWTASAGRWRLLIHVLGLKHPPQFHVFKRLLRTERPICLPFLQAMLAKVSAPEQLSHCQDLMLELGSVKDEQRPVAALTLLSAPPFSFSVEQIVASERYLGRDAPLEEFLDVLVSAGYTDAVSVLAFQRLFCTHTATTLKTYLDIARPRAAGCTVDEIVDWVALAAKGGYSDECRYLATALHLTTIVQLHQILKLAVLGLPMLRYLVQEQSLDSLPLLRDWYRKDAMGIHQLRQWGEIAGLRKVLIDDAFARKSFNLVEKNQQCIDATISARVAAIVPAWTGEPDDFASRKQHFAIVEAACRDEEPLVLAVLPQVLSATRGILLAGLLAGVMARPDDLNDYLAQLDPLIDGLLHGAGPTAHSLSEMEADAIALLYRTTPGTVLSTWPQVRGKRTSLAAMKAMSQPMEWKGIAYEFVSTVDLRGLAALARAAAFARHFASHSDNMHAACKYLRTKQLGHRSSDVWTLAHHLGILLSIAGSDEVVAEWTRRGLEALARCDDDVAANFQQYDALQVLFEATLPDALDAGTGRFIAQLPEAEAAILAAKLGISPGPAPARAALKEAIVALRAWVLPRYQRWVRSQKKKFKPLGSESRVTRLQGVVSQQPAAFFAKEAAKICTAGNTEMWNEERQSHLLVFDQARRMLAGMALLYVEIIPEMDAIRPSLIIRAMNPMDEMVAVHTASSVVDAYFGFAIEFAKANGLAAVAFPPHSCMHLLSNHEDIEADIKARFIAPAKSYFRDEGNADALYNRPRIVNARFDAYERGTTQQSTLYVIWRASTPLRGIGVRGGVMEADLQS